jgi:predicted secreted hydrolase
MNRFTAYLFLLIILAGSLWWWQDSRQATAEVRASLLPLLTEEDSAGFARATEPGAIEFPRDLGPHNDYQTEWWYYTGNLQSADGRPFGFQLTFFRRALTPPGALTPRGALTPAEGANQEPPSGGSAWRTSQVYLAHFALTDVAGDNFYYEERFSRGAAGLAGAQAVPYRVWLENWYAAEVGPGRVHLFARTGEVTIDLTLTETMAPILHGHGGLSPKGPEPGNASYYYSIVRQETVGKVTVPGQEHAVTGLSWKDHEYSTSALPPAAVGWDWFSLQLDDGTAVMFFQIRREDGSLEPASSGSFIHADGTVQSLSWTDWRLDISDSWRSPASGATYPAGWHIEIAPLNLVLQGAPLLAGQELNVSATYWEGAVAFHGRRAGQPVSARGYIEMTGYYATMAGRF